MVIKKHMPRIAFMNFWIILMRMPPKTFDDKSTSAQAMAWRRQTTNHYLNQCWPRSMSPYGFIRPRRVNVIKLIFYLIFHLHVSMLNFQMFCNYTTKIIASQKSDPGNGPQTRLYSFSALATGRSVSGSIVNALENDPWVYELGSTELNKKHQPISCLLSVLNGCYFSANVAA